MEAEAIVGRVVSLLYACVWANSGLYVTCCCILTMEVRWLIVRYFSALML
jgi:hypothetical protein